MIGTGQTAWLQGARYSIMLDSLVSDFIAGELEHAMWLAWTEDPKDDFARLLRDQHKKTKQGLRLAEQEMTSLDEVSRVAFFE